MDPEENNSHRFEGVRIRDPLKFSKVNIENKKVQDQRVFHSRKTLWESKDQSPKSKVQGNMIQDPKSKKKLILIAD